MKFVLALLTVKFLSLLAEADGRFYHLRSIRSKTLPLIQEQTVRDMIKRLVGDRANEFLVEIIPQFGLVDKDIFKIESEDEFIKISANTGVAAAWGFQHYLKYYCNCHFSWSGNQLYLPQPLPSVIPALIVTSNDKFRYYQNVCTPSYSMVWWNWTRWEKEIDWMALNGINLPLAFTGQEAIWRRTFLRLNFTNDDVNDFFTGPAFLAWNRMGNVQKWAGPLSVNWHLQQMYLQHKILNRMRNFGMTPVLPAFAGHVLPATPRVYPKANVTAISWGSFTPPYSNVYFLSPTDPLFQTFATTFLEEYISEYGTDHIYNTDLFNEMSPPSSQPSFLRTCGQAVFRSLVSVDPKAIWLMQGWLFVNDPSFWQPAQAQALLTSVPIGRMLILDLEAEFYPQYQRLESFYGQPFIWCMLHNYGGVNGLYGSFWAVNAGPFTARNYPNSTMMGTGLTPEGIEQNDVMYEFMNEMAWRRESCDLPSWISNYTLRRYGKLSSNLTKAWIILQRSVYNASKAFRDHGKYVLVRRPSLSAGPQLWFNNTDVYKAWYYFINVLDDEQFTLKSTFLYDLVDLTREVLQLLVAEYFEEAKTFFRKKDEENLRKTSTIILGILKDLENVLTSNVHFLAGKWFQDARNLGVTPNENNLYEFNARNQITLWGPNGEILDYATKQWSGMMSGYFYPRWFLFLNTLQDCLSQNKRFNQSEFNWKVKNFVEEQFAYSTDVYPSHPLGNTVQIVRDLWQKYHPSIIKK
ncbi:alpha-N-acetylglucosaminidase-like [Centruroides sculpturatus]|uniref:alpha-N-acetylglucosaminidase-like n=1 Tax=Centruroides sculpturatus TaxID=218467 RepID=UPI000C6D120A|nr:alpha-N-acetylglucosaminidase-like [Centruroides sculpturatus]